MEDLEKQICDTVSKIVKEYFNTHPQDGKTKYFETCLVYSTKGETAFSSFKASTDQNY